MAAVNPYAALNDEIKSESVIQSLTYGQMCAAANGLFNLYWLLDEIDRCGLTSSLSEVLMQVKDSAARDHDDCQSVHQAFVNCLMLMDKAYKTQHGA